MKSGHTSGYPFVSKEKLVRSSRFEPRQIAEPGATPRAFNTDSASDLDRCL
jgi:hypothetical protein